MIARNQSNQPPVSGDEVIESIILADAVDAVDVGVLVWKAGAAEQIEAALMEIISKRKGPCEPC